MSRIIIISIICYTCLASICVAKSLSSRRNCDQLPLKILKRLHGQAFDARYMSISEPIDSDNDNIMEDTEDSNRKRSAVQSRPAFYITEEHYVELSDEPAWNFQWDEFDDNTAIHTRKKRSIVPIGVDVNFTNDGQEMNQSEEIQRIKRGSSNYGVFKQMKCEKRIKWIHLGPDYHPSHLRTVECTQSTCFYSHGTCRPKQFAVRILRRRRGVCADAPSLQLALYGFSGKQAEVWEWIEVALNFCCDCSAQ